MPSGRVARGGAGEDGAEGWARVGMGAD